MHYQQYQPQQSQHWQNSPNASLATMSPTTFQNSPYHQSNSQMGQQQQYQPQQYQQSSQQQYQPQQYQQSSQQQYQPQQILQNAHQQQQEQAWLQQVRQELHGAQSQGSQMPNASIATMGPSTYQDSPYSQYGFRPQQYQAQFQQNLQGHEGSYQPIGQHYSNQNASHSTMDPTTYQNSPFVNQQFGQSSMGQQSPFQHGWQQSGNLNASLATMSPTTYQNSPYRQKNN